MTTHLVMRRSFFTGPNYMKANLWNKSSNSNHNLDLKWQNFFEQIMLHLKSLYVYSYMPNIKQKAWYAKMKT